MQHAGEYFDGEKQRNVTEFEQVVDQNCRYQAVELFAFVQPGQTDDGVCDRGADVGAHEHKHALFDGNHPGAHGGDHNCDGCGTALNHRRDQDAREQPRKGGCQRSVEQALHEGAGTLRGERQFPGILEAREGQDETVESKQQQDRRNGAVHEGGSQVGRRFSGVHGAVLGT